MALSRAAKVGIAAVAALALFGFAGDALADVVDDDDTPPPPPPPDIPPIPAFDPDDDDPLPPKPMVCNFSGCGPKFDSTHSAPTYYALRLQQLGYPINPAVQGFNIVSNANRSIVREFQRDWNHVKPTVPGWAGKALLDDDGLVGNLTIDAINKAHALQTARIQSWAVIVDLVP